MIDRRVPESKPFFLWLTYTRRTAVARTEPDDPQAASAPSTRRRTATTFASEPLPSMPSFNEADVSDKPAGIRNRPALDAAEDRRDPRGLPAADSSRSSRWTTASRRSSTRCSAKGELDNTLLVFTADNGFFHGQHRVPSGKVLLYEPSIRVPLLDARARRPARTATSKQMTANIDLAPTIVDAANAKAGRVMDGKSLLPLLAHPTTQWGRDLLIERGPAGAKLAGTAMGEIGDGDNGNQGKTAAPGDRQFIAIRTPSFLYAEYGTARRSCTTWRRIRTS